METKTCKGGHTMTGIGFDDCCPECESPWLKPQRTLKQNRSMHELFEQISTELNTLGLDMRIVLKPTYQIWWTPTSVKEDLWKPLQKAMFKKNSTTELTTAEVDKVFEQLAKIIGEKHGVEFLFPSEENSREYLESFKQ